MRRGVRKRVGPTCIQPGEHVVARLRPAWRHYVRYYIPPLIASLAIGRRGEVLSLCWFLISILVVCSRYSNLFIVTTQRVVEQTGLIARNTAQACLSDIQLINTREGVVDRLLGVGHVKIESAAHNGKAGDIVFGGVLRPILIKEMIFRIKYSQRRRRKKIGFRSSNGS